MSSASTFVWRMHLGRRGHRRALAVASNCRTLRRRDLAFEALQRPVAAALHLRRHAGQRHDRADLLALTAELERRDVALDAVVIRGERRRARQLDRAVHADQTPARDRGRGHDRDRGDHAPGEDGPSDLVPPEFVTATLAHEKPRFLFGPISSVRFPVRGFRRSGRSSGSLMRQRRNFQPASMPMRMNARAAGSGAGSGVRFDPDVDADRPVGDTHAGDPGAGSDWSHDAVDAA